MFEKHGVPVLAGATADTPEDAHAAAELIGRIERSPRLRMQGLHVHVGSQILDVEPFARSVGPIAALGRFPVYDLGGGLGARYSYAAQPPTVGAYLDALVGAAREHRSAGGEGLGLAIAARAIALHGGKISAANAAGGGLLVSVTLPADVREPAERSPAAVAAA